MNPMKKYYYVGVGNNENGILLVTEVNQNTYYWDKNKKPKPFLSKSTADELALCLHMNGITAVTLTSYSEINDQIFSLAK